MSSSTTSKRVFNALSVFGSVQIVNVLCSIARTKCVAMWLGTAGIGIFALYNSTLEIINQLIQLNLRQSGVREISNAAPGRFKLLVSVVRRLGSLLGLAGAALTVVLSPVLSRITFGDESHTLPFVLLAVVVFFNALTAGEQAVLQASDRLHRLAAASMWGGVVATVISIALIWFAGYDGILPSIVVYSVVTAIAYYIGRDKIPCVRVSVKETLREACPIIRLGTYMTAAMFLTSLSQYLFIVWLRTRTDDSGVGLYQSGYMLVNQYIGLVFSAMAFEFFPRLSAVVGHRIRVMVYVKHEILIMMIGLVAAIPLFLNLVPVIINLLYDSTFMAASGYITIASVGTVFRAFSFVLAFVILARADGRIYLITETVSSILYIVLNIIGFSRGGYEGLGYAYVVWYFLYLVSVTLVYCLLFKYSFSGLARELFIMMIVAIVVAAQATLCIRGYYLAATIVTCAVLPTSGYMLYRLFLRRRTLKE